MYYYGLHANFNQVIESMLKKNPRTLLHLSQNALSWNENRSWASLQHGNLKWRRFIYFFAHMKMEQLAYDAILKHGAVWGNALQQKKKEKHNGYGIMSIR